MNRVVGIAVVIASCMASLAFAEPVSFRKDIAPVLLRNCIACHGPKKAEGGYRADSFDRAKKPGASEADAVVAAKPDDSELFRRLTTTDAKERMPLDSDPLPAEQIALIRRWIMEGAAFDGPNPAAELITIVPPPTHPEPPAAYRHTLPITALAFSPDGQKLYVGGYHELNVWNPADGQLVQRIKNVGQRTYSLAFSPDGQTLAVACGAPGQLGEVRLLDVASGQVKQVVAMTSDVVFDARFSPNGETLATAAADSTVRLFEVATGKEQRVITSHSDWVMAVAFSPDGSRLASASRDKTAKVFDLKTGELVITFSDHGQPVRGVTFHPKGDEVISGGADNKVVQWKIADGKKSADVSSFGGEVNKLAVSGPFLFAPSADKSVKQWEHATRKEVRVYSGHTDWALSTAYHDGTKRLATGTFDGEVRVWNAEDGKVVTTFHAAPGYQKPAK